jgi:hypothetical protein
MAWLWYWRKGHAGISSDLTTADTSIFSPQFALSSPGQAFPSPPIGITLPSALLVLPPLASGGGGGGGAESGGGGGAATTANACGS